MRLIKCSQSDAALVVLSCVEYSVSVRDRVQVRLDSDSRFVQVRYRFGQDIGFYVVFCAIGMVVP